MLLLQEIGEPVDAATLTVRARELGDAELDGVGEHLPVRLAAGGRFEEFDQVCALLAAEQERRSEARAAALVASCAEQRERRGRVAAVAAPGARHQTNEIRKGSKVELRQGSPSWKHLTRHGLWDAGELRGALAVTGTHDAGALVDVALVDGRPILGLRASDLEQRGDRC